MRLSLYMVCLTACASATPSWAPEKCRRRDSDGIRHTLCKDEITEVMKGHVAALQACVGPLRPQADKPNGLREVDASFVIKPDGTTTERSVTPRTLAGSLTAHCVDNVLENLQFPAFLHGTIPVTFPIRL